MNKFISFQVGSMKLKIGKWMPRGVLYKGSLLNQTVLEFPKKLFDTETEANNFFSNYCIRKKYIQLKKK